jgi:hypothetical protein
VDCACRLRRTREGEGSGVESALDRDPALIYVKGADSEMAFAVCQ